MPADKSAPPVVPPVARRPPSHVILTADYGPWLSGKVLSANADLLAQLDVEKARYREATLIERRIGGFPD